MHREKKLAANAGKKIREEGKKVNDNADSYYQLCDPVIIDVSQFIRQLQHTAAAD